LQNISDHVLNGNNISVQQARQILQAKGSDLSFILAGAHRIKEKFLVIKLSFAQL